jgi:hypothetical protein
MTRQNIFFVMKVSPERVAMREQKAWKNRRLASGIATRLLPAALQLSAVTAVPIREFNHGSYRGRRGGREQIRNPNVESATSMKHEIEKGTRVGWRAPRAKENLRSMEQCFGAKGGKHNVFTRRLCHDCPMQLASRDEKLK